MTMPNLLIRVIATTALAVLPAAGTLWPVNAEAAYIKIKPQHVTILEDVPLYDDYEHPGQPLGALAAPQTLSVKDVDKDWSLSQSSVAQWYLVETWLGDKWIPAGDSVIAGEYGDEQREWTVVFEAPLFDRPDDRYETDLKISPQKVKASAHIESPILQGSSAISFLSGPTHWYRIETWLGDKWLRNPALLENVKEEPADFDLKLTGEETAYPIPFRVDTSAESIGPQIVKAVAQWDDRKGPWGSVWYKIRLPQGERWVAPAHRALPNIRVIDEQVNLPTETRYFDQPEHNWDRTNWLAPGSYEAFEVWEDWVHLRTPEGEKWVNLKRAPLERPVGIVKTDETIGLTEETQTYYFPQTGEIAHIKGFYAPQTVQAFEKWASETGEVWYHFHGWGGDEWTTAPPSASSGAAR
jgi:hypothetical protein